MIAIVLFLSSYAMLSALFINQVGQLEEITPSDK